MNPSTMTGQDHDDYEDLLTPMDLEDQFALALLLDDSFTEWLKARKDSHEK